MPTVLDTRIVNRHRVQPNHTNNYGSANGGTIMKWMDEIGALSAMRFAGESCVTAAMDALDFRRPIPRGETALIEAYVFDAGRTSVDVHLRVDREDPRTGETERTTDARFVFVAVRDGSPVEVPELAVESERGEALRRRALEDA